MKYVVHLARLRIEVAEVEVEVKLDRGQRAGDRTTIATAEMMAKLKANGLDEMEWQDLGHAAGYDPWPVLTVSQREARAEGMTLAEHSYETDPLDGKEYILLEADTKSGQGRLIVQSWFARDEPGLLEHDIAADWIGELQHLVRGGLDEGDFPTKPDDQPK